jgi:hypothetical protein
MTARWTSTLLTIALLLVGGYGKTAPAAPLASSAPAQHLLLSDDLLDRMMAVARERQAIEQAHPANDDEDDSEDGDGTGVPTLASMAKRMDADPATRALLARHGFTGQSYLLALTTLAHAGAQARMGGTKWASKMPGAATVDPRNISFYRQHAAKISALNALNNPDYSPEEDARMTHQLRNIDPEDMDDCVLLAPSLVSLTPYMMPGSTEVSPSDRIKLAKSTGELAEHFHSEALKKDFTLMADEIRRHAYAKRMESAPFGDALGRVHDWAADHCKGDEK